MCVTRLLYKVNTIIAAWFFHNSKRHHKSSSSFRAVSLAFRLAAAESDQGNLLSGANALFPAMKQSFSTALLLGDTDAWSLLTNGARSATLRRRRGTTIAVLALLVATRMSI